MKECFVFYAKWAEALAGLPDKTRRAVIGAVTEYGLTGRLPERLSAVESALFALLRMQMESAPGASQSAPGAPGRVSNPGASEETTKPELEQKPVTCPQTARYEENAQRPGRVSNPGASQISGAPGASQIFEKEKRESNKENKERDTQGSLVGSSFFGGTGEFLSSVKTERAPGASQSALFGAPDIPAAVRKRAPETIRVRFAPPSQEETRAYMDSRGFSGSELESARFCDYYASKGWKVGGSVMRDWRAAARNWMRRRTDRSRPGTAGDPYAGVVLSPENRVYKGGWETLDLSKHTEPCFSLS